MIYSFDWKGKFIEERLALLMQMGFDFEYDANLNLIDLRKTGFSSGELEVLKFVQNLSTPVNFSVFDYALARPMLELHYKFWKERFNGKS